MSERPHRHDDKITFKVSADEQAALREHLQDTLSRELALAQLFELPTPLSKALIAVLVALFVVMFYVGDATIHQKLGVSIARFAPVELASLTGMKLHAQMIDDGQWWRLITSAFVHLSFLHLGFNAYALWALGPACERFYGRARFVIIYLGSAILSSLASLAYTQAPSGGASGAVFGLLGALLVFGVKYRDVLPPRVARALTLGMLPWVVLNLGIGFFSALPIDNAAHIGGLVSGGLLALGLRARLAPPRFRLGNLAALLLAVVLSAATVASGWAWYQEGVRCAASRDTFLSVCYPQQPIEADRASGRAQSR